MNATTTKSAPRYLLGTTNGYGEYLFTGLPVFKSGLEAADFARSHPMNGVVVVFEERDVSRYGVVYGIERKAVATVRC